MHHVWHGKDFDFFNMASDKAQERKRMVLETFIDLDKQTGDGQLSQFNRTFKKFEN